MNTKVIEILVERIEALEWVLKLKEEKVDELEEVSGLQAPVKGTNDKVVQIKHRQIAR